MNTCSIMGNLCSDPDMRSSSEGLVYTKFTVAVSRPKKNSGADFINCVAFGSLAEFVSRYFVKGQKIALTGRIQVDNYRAKDGTNRRETSIIANNVFFCDYKSKDVSGNNSAANNHDPLEDNDNYQEGPCDMEVPF